MQVSTGLFCKRLTKHSQDTHCYAGELKHSFRRGRAIADTADRLTNDAMKAKLLLKRTAVLQKNYQPQGRHTSGVKLLRSLQRPTALAASPNLVCSLLPQHSCPAAQQAVSQHQLQPQPQVLPSTPRAKPIPLPCLSVKCSPFRHQRPTHLPLVRVFAMLHLPSWICGPMHASLLTIDGPRAIPTFVLALSSKQARR